MADRYPNVHQVEAVKIVESFTHALTLSTMYPKPVLEMVRDQLRYWKGDLEHEDGVEVFEAFVKFLEEEIEEIE